MIYEIWLGEHYSHFERGLVHCADGSTHPLKGWIHSATYGPDTLLLDDATAGAYANFPLRWYIREKGLSFYCWDAEIHEIIFHNDSGRELVICRYGILGAGETKRFRKDTHE